ncbi:MAG: PAS domain S-box protein, partial [Bauldia sp.]
ITIVGHAMIDRLLRRIYEYRWQLEWRSLAIDALAEGVVIIQEGAIRYANAAAAAMVGCTPEQIVGAALGDFVSIDERTDLARPLRIDAPGGAAAGVRVSRADIVWQGKPATLVSVADVTEQQRADEALRKSEEHYRTVIDNVSETIIIAQGNRLVFANPRAEELTGFTVDELTARPFVQLLHAEDVALVADRYSRRMRGEEAERYTQFRVQRRDGSHVWVESSAVRILWNGEPATLAFLGDQTERRKADEALRHSEERFRLLVDHASEGILISQDGILRFVNPRIAELTGRGEAELVGKPLLDYIHADDRPVLVDRHRRRRRGEPVPSHEVFRLVRDDGEIVWIEFSGVDVEWEGAPAVLSFL